MTKIQKYVKRNWEKLPKSTFDEHEVVIVYEKANYDGGYGHHNYEGVGIGKAGNVYWCYSSGCSCDGTCGIEHKPDFKTLEVEQGMIEKIDPADVPFEKYSVSFSNY